MEQKEGKQGLSMLLRLQSELEASLSYTPRLHLKAKKCGEEEEEVEEEEEHEKEISSHVEAHL